eukprot:CAMPEP_0167795250 /NCGR_PEP_ID=MMETSP0111_2-20121227/14325_1 /TAXON_ID=91324 /ORGANISM="Lotharella globosa, Strain CCCM811" /LENGTH=575 /DNA_ID=CAMNT_0007688885 /DNA_START=83 /DNA_END=1807 /DNA_ORIENTATION=-
MADFRRAGKVDGMTVKKMFSMANPPLHHQLLASIWELSNQSKQPGALTKPDFYRALRYIALAQHGQPVNPQALSLSNSRRVGLPKLSGFNNQQIIATFSKNPRGISQMYKQKPQQPAAPAPQQTQQPQQTMPRPTTNPQSQQQMPVNVAQGNAQQQPQAVDPAVFEMKDQDHAAYMKFFTGADLDRDGYVSGKEANHFFKMSKLPSTVLRDIWILADVDKNNKLDKEEFAIAMHLVMKVRNGVPLPRVLPACLAKLKANDKAAQSDGPPSGGRAADDNDPLRSFVSGPSVLKKQPSALALNRDSEIIPLESSIKAATARRDDFDAELKLNNEQMTQSLTEINELKTKLKSLNKESEEIQDKIKDAQETLAHYDQQKVELHSQVEDRQDTVQTHKETLGVLESKLQDARSIYEEKSMALNQQQQQINTVKSHEREMEADMDRMQRETEVIMSKIERGKARLTAAENRAKECEERKVQQQMILKEKQDMLAKIQSQVGDHQDIINKAKKELDMLKQESRRLRDQIKASGGGFHSVKAVIDQDILREQEHIAELKAQLGQGGGSKTTKTQPGDDPFGA